MFYVAPLPAGSIPSTLRSLDSWLRGYLSAFRNPELRRWGGALDVCFSVDYTFSVSTVQEISEAIQHLDVRGQMQLLRDLPAHLKIQPDDIAWLKAAEPAFEFWNNPEDAVYDEL